MLQKEVTLATRTGLVMGGVRKVGTLMRQVMRWRLVKMRKNSSAVNCLTKNCGSVQEWFLFLGLAVTNAIGSRLEARHRATSTEFTASPIRSTSQTFT